MVRESVLVAQSARNARRTESEQRQATNRYSVGHFQIIISRVTSKPYHWSFRPRRPKTAESAQIDSLV